MPTVAVELTAADEWEILAVLDVDRSRLRGLDGYRFTNHPGTMATVAVARAQLAPGLEAVDELQCVQRDAAWTCLTETPAERIYAALPAECAAHRIPGQGEPYMKFSFRGDFSIGQIYGILGLVCTSDEIFEQAWSKRHSGGVRRNADGEVELRTLRPDTDEHGLLFVLEERCRDGSCEYVVAALRRWVT